MARVHSPLWPDQWIKPSYGAVQINWGHQLAQGLTSAWLMQHGVGPMLYDLAGKNHATNLGTGYSWYPNGRHRLAAGCSGTETAWQIDHTPAAQVLNSIAAGVKIPNPWGWRGLICAAGGDNGPLHRYDGYMSWYGGSGKSSTTQAVGSEHTWGMTNACTNSSLDYYLDGKFDGGGFNPPAGASWTPIYLLRDSSNERWSGNGWVAYIYWWNRILTAAEFAWLNAEPYCFLKSVIPRSYGFRAAAGGTTYYGSYSGSLSSSGALTRQPAKSLTGTAASAGSLVKSLARTLAGVLSSAGGLASIKTKLLTLAGALASVGTLTKLAARSLTAAAASTGTLTRSTSRALAGTIGSAGALSALKTRLMTIAGALASAGGLTKQTGRVVTGGLASAGAVTKAAARVLAGSVASTGALSAIKTRLLTVAGSIGSVGSLSRQVGKALTGALSSTGGVIKRIGRSLSGALASAGALATSWLPFGVVPWVQIRFSRTGAIVEATGSARAVTVPAGSVAGPSIGGTARRMEDP